MLTKRESRLLQMIGAEIEARKEEVCRGGLTHEEYRDLTGFIRGLQTAIGFVLDLDKDDQQS